MTMKAMKDKKAKTKTKAMTAMKADKSKKATSGTGLGEKSALRARRRALSARRRALSRQTHTHKKQTKNAQTWPRPVAAGLLGGMPQAVVWKCLLGGTPRFAYAWAEPWLGGFRCVCVGA